MNYILRKVNCKALIVAVLVVASTIASVVVGYAYTMRKIPNFWFDGKYVYVAENVSPRQSSYTSVLISYDNLADLVYYCNEHGLCATLAYNSQISRYVGYVTDEALDLSKFGVTSLRGLLGNVDGYVYVAERENSTSVTVNNFNQTIINNSSGSASGSTGSPYVSSSWQEKELLGKIYEKLWFINEWLQITKDWVKEVNYNVKNVNTNINNNVVPALVAINKNLSSMLTDTVSRLSSIQSASWASVDAENRILSTLTGIGNQLGSVIRNGQLQVNISPLEARLDKLISMYSKVNSVVLDTASVTGGQITGAVGGELKDVVFWGDTSKVNNTFVSADGVAYTLNDTPVDINGLTLRSVNMGSTIPSYIANDPVLYAGVWRKGTDYIISDTYNASTGEYVKRIETFTFTPENLQDAGYEIMPRGGSVYLFQLVLPIPKCCVNGAYDLTYYLHVPYMDGFGWGESTSNIDDFVNYACVYHNGFVLGVNSSFLANDVFSYLVTRTPAMEMLFVPDPEFGWSPTVQYFDPSTIAIPEGNSYISSYNVRITGKYETYDSYTQTADIISGIGRTEALLSSINTAVQDIKSYTSSIKTTTSTISTNVGKVNTTISSVISQGKLKVDNSAVVAAIEGIQAGSAADLSPVIVRMDAILAELQSAPGSAACEHTYTQHTEQEATCTLPGLLIFTCSQCGDSYSEIVDPLGHDWIVTSHVDAVTDPETGEESASAYDVYTCSRCQRTYEDHTGSGPEEDYSSSSISKLVVKVFSRLGTFAGKLIGSVIHLFDKAITALDNVVSKFNEYVEQISGFGGDYPAWLTGFWGVLPAELQVALTFAVICMALGVVGKKLFFS